MLLVALLALAVVRAQVLSSAEPVVPPPSSAAANPVTPSIRPSSAVLSRPPALSSTSAVRSAAPLTTIPASKPASSRSIVTVTVSASVSASDHARANTATSSSSKSGGDIAAIVLGIICALEAVVIVRATRPDQQAPVLTPGHTRPPHAQPRPPLRPPRAHAARHARAGAAHSHADDHAAHEAHERHACRAPPPAPAAGRAQALAQGPTQVRGGRQDGRCVVERCVSGPTLETPTSCDTHEL